MKYLPENLSYCSHLEKLILSHNQITFIPTEYSQLAKLKVLSLDFNEVISFPCSFEKHNSLTEFGFDWVKYLNPPMAFHIDEGRFPKFWNNFKTLMRYLITNEKYECEIADFLGHFNSLYNERDFTDYMFDINHTDSRQKTLLHHAAATGDIGFVKALINVPDINLNILDKDDCTPLCVALREQHFEIAKILIEADADVNAGGGEIFGSALHLAVVRSNLLIVDLLIKKLAEVNTIDKDGNTPLHFIMNIFSKSETKFRAIAESLVMSEAKPNSRNKEMWAPLHIAARKGMLEAIRWAKMINEILHELDLEGFDFNAPGGP